MRILFVTPQPGESSGYGRYSADVIHAARRAGHHVECIVVGPIALGLMNCVRRARHSDIIYGIDGWPFGFIAWIAAVLWRKMLIIGAIGTYTIAPLRGHWYSRFIRAAYSTADAVIAISGFTQRRLQEIVPSAKCVLVTPGVDAAYWGVSRASGPNPVLISVGGVKPRKGYHAVLESFAEARCTMPSLQWVVVGNLSHTAYVDRLKRRAQELGVDQDIRWCGEVSDDNLRRLYSNSGIFILLPGNDGVRFEGFGIVFLEAAAAGLPVIGAFGSGVEDAVGPANGLLVPQGDSIRSASAVVSILTDTQRWHTMSASSIEWANHHSVERMCAIHAAIYDDLASKTG